MYRSEFETKLRKLVAKRRAEVEMYATLAIFGELADQFLGCQVQTPSKTNLANRSNTRHRGVGVLRASGDGTLAILGELASQLLGCQVQTPSKINLANRSNTR